MPLVRWSGPFQSTLNIDFRHRTTAARGTIPLATICVTLRDELIAGVLPNQQDGHEASHQDSNCSLNDRFS